MTDMKTLIGVPVHRFAFLLAICLPVVAVQPAPAQTRDAFEAIREADMRVATTGYRLSTANVPERLHSELGARAASVSGDNGLLHFQFSTREQVNEAIDSLRAEKCEIEAIVPTTSTLEDVFVKAVEE